MINRDFVDVSDRVLARKAMRVESWLETIAAGVAAVLSVVVFGLIVLMLGV
jgi:hypothetical protein